MSPTSGTPTPEAQLGAPVDSVSDGRAEKYSENTVYELFIALVTLLSLLVMLALMVIPESTAVFGIFGIMDLLMCAILLLDFVIKLFRVKSKRAYMKTGWMDLLGSMPTIPGIPGIYVFRLFRLYRLYSSYRVLKVRRPSYVVREMVRRRAEAAFYLTLLAALVLLILCSSIVAIVEPGATGGSIENADDAIWWAYETITTVGYGDVVPVTMVGRLTGMLLMTFGIAVFGVLTSFLASVFATKPGDAADIAAAGGLPGGIGAVDDAADEAAHAEREDPSVSVAPPTSVIHSAGEPSAAGALLDRVAAVQIELADIERALRELTAEG